MNIHFDIPNTDKFQQVSNKAPGVVLRNMRLAMEISCRDVQHDARAKHLFRTRTGALEKAIDTAIKQNKETGIEGIVYIDDDKAPYGKWVHGGTRPHIIRPKNKKALRWPVSNGTGFCFAKIVHHPGTKPDPFIYQAGENNRQHINDVFARYTNRAIQEVGL